MTQEEIILHHLQDNGSITTMEAIEGYGITRLSARIFELRAQGHKIDNLHQQGRNRFGQKVRYDRYVLRDSNE